jgi:hypothetical protein
MKKSILISLILLFVIFNWSLNPAMKRAEAYTQVKLSSPLDSVKITKIDTVFKWEADKDQKEVRKKYHIVVARNFELTDRIWDDSTTLHPTQSKRYNGPPFVQWETYFWSVRVQVDSIKRIDTTDTRIDTIWAVKGLWYDFVKPRTFFYTTATLIKIPENLPSIQKGIVFAASGDTVLVKPQPEPYYENLRFYKKGVLLASHFIFNKTNTALIESTIIDGSKLTRGEDNGSVIYFSSKADSTSKVIGFTIRNGKGTKSLVGSVEKVNGGGIFCDLGSYPTIAYNKITKNQVPDDGGGIFCYSAAPNILNNIITQNSAGGSGGAIQCYFSIRTKPATSSNPPGGENGEIEIIPNADLEPTLPELNSEKEEDWEDIIYPKDATEVLPAFSPDPLFKATQDPNNPPVAVLDYRPKESKYRAGDTIWLDVSGSYDPDSASGDSIARMEWRGERWDRCENPDDWRTYSVPSVGYIRVTASMGGLYRIRLIVEDTYRSRDTSEFIYLNLQRPPTTIVKEDTVIAPGDTGWLDGSGSCDINPDDDTTLSFLWTQISGPVNVTINDPESPITFFNPYDETYGGTYLFELKVSDSDTFSADTQKITVDRFPVAVAFDSLAGFPATIESTITRTDTLGHTIVKDTIVPAPLPLDASLSFDPDTAVGDSVAYFIWEGISYTTCKGSFPFTITKVDSAKKMQYFPASQGGGIYKVRLYVRDTHGVRSKNADTLLISAQLRPTAKAGNDTIVGWGENAYLRGDACEVNWDQKDSLKYVWIQDPTNPSRPTWWDINGTQLNPDYAETRVVWFTAPSVVTYSGIYRFSLKVWDPYQVADPDGKVKVTVNARPRAVITAPTGSARFAEGDTVKLDASGSYDPDAQVLPCSLKFTWTIINWPGSPDNTYKPTMINPDKSIAKFIPLKYGTYEFQTVVHDTFSPRMYPPVVDTLNKAKITVMVDTTFAYPIVRGNLISSNTAGSRGGGIDCFQSAPDIINNIFYKNTCGSSGGGVCTRFSSAPLIKRNIFFGNISGDATGGGIANLKAEQAPAATIGFRPKMVVSTNDFWNNAGGDLYQPPADVSGNLIDEYPRLIDPEYGDFTLECSSPCLKDSIGLLLWLYPDTCETTPPPGMISLSLFQHPVVTSAAHFVVNTDVALKAPPEGWVRIGENSPAVIDFTSISSTTYTGEFFFTTSGTAHISVFVSSVQEVPDTLTKDFTVQLMGTGKTGKLVSHDSQLWALFPQGAAQGDIYATCISVSDDPKYSFKDEDKESLGEAYQVGPVTDFNQELTISFPLDDYDLTEKDNTLFSIYKYDKNGWEKQTSFLDENSICARVKELGIFRLVYDANQEHITAIPKTYQLFQNYPNPFNPLTMIKYDLPHSGHVNIVVYNILGQKVKTLADEYQEAAHHSVTWDGKDDQGEEVASGVYFYRIKTSLFEKTKKMVLLK